MRGVVASAVTAGLFLLFSSTFLFSADRVRVRDPKIACGLYLSSMANDSNAVKVADLDNMKDYFHEEPALVPELVYRDAVTRQIIEDAGVLRKKIVEGTAEPVIAQKILFVVGTPLWGAEKHERMEEVRKEVDELGLTNDVKIKAIGRPVNFLQQIVYLFPLPMDFQTPLPSEKTSTALKLVISNGSQLGFSLATMPLNRALLMGAMNFTNSTVTGIYMQTVANWFGRSKNQALKFLRGNMYNAFFTMDLYWAVQPWNKFKEIIRLKGWHDFVKNSWFSQVFSVSWRYPFEQSLNQWSNKMEARGRGFDGRRTNNSLKFLVSTFLTPAYLWSIAGPKTMFGQHFFNLNEGHLAMLAMGGVGALYFFQILKWDPWVERLDNAAAFFKKSGKMIGLSSLSKKILKKQKTSNLFEKSPYEKDLREILHWNNKLLDLTYQDPDLLDLIQRDSKLFRVLQETQKSDLRSRQP